MNALYQPVRLIIGLLAGLLFCVSLPSGVSAAGEAARESITLSPVSKQYKLTAGETKTDELTIINDGTNDYDFKVYAEPYSVSNDTYDPDFYNQHANTDIQGWIKPAQAVYHLAAGQSTKVEFSIVVPKNATPGGHYAAIFAETQPSGIVTGNSVVRKKRVGAIVYATVNGEYKVGGSSIGSSITPFQFTAPLKATSSVENTGNTDFTTNVTLEVADLLGHKKYSTTNDYHLLPRTSRMMPVEWTHAPSFGLYKATLTSSFLDQTIRTSSYVLMAPIWAYLVTAVALLALVTYAVQRRR